MRPSPDALIIVGLLVVAGTVHLTHMTVTPALTIKDDEGTYVSQAWAILKRGELAHYTYWYDHPPLGWIQLAGWAWVTRAFERYDFAVAAGREFMLVVKLASVALLYLLARRLDVQRFFAVAAVLLFALSPLAVFFHRLTFLDNISVAWLLAAFVLAAAPRARMATTLGSALCFAVAVLTKETMLVVLPALLYQLWQGTDARTRRMNMSVWLWTFVLLCLFYPLTAVIKNELFPGDGHVDLVSAIRWQLFDRASSGSVADGGTPANSVVRSWARSDPWLLGLAIAAIVPALLTRRLRAVTLALTVQILILLRPSGYLPLPYVIGLMPFAALTLAATVGTIWRSGLLERFPLLRRQLLRGRMSWAQALVRFPAACMVATFVMAVAVPRWSPALGDLMTDDRTVPARQALDWLETNVATHDDDGQPIRILVSDAMWVDLTERGYAADWYFKVDLDPAVQRNYARGWRDVGYVVFTNEMNEIARSADPDIVTTLDARENGQLVAAFGSGSDRLRIYRVNAPPLAPGSGGVG